MNDKVIIEEVTGKLVENLQAESKLNDETHQQMDIAEWKALLLQRSEAIRSFYNENEEYCRILREYSAGQLNDEIANALFETIRAIWLQGRLDGAFLSEIAPSVIDYFIAHGEVEKAIIATSIRNASVNEYYVRMGLEGKRQELIKAYEWILSNRERYAQLRDVRAKNNFWYAYENLLLIYSQGETDKERLHTFELLHEMREFLNEVKTKVALEPDELAEAIVETTNSTVPLEINLIGYNSGETLEKFIETIDEYLANHNEDEDWDAKIIYKLLSIRKDSLRNNLDHNVAASEIEKLFDELPEPDWEDAAHSQTVFVIFSYIYHTVMLEIQLSSFLSEEKIERVDRAVAVFNKVIKGIPYLFLTDYINDAYRNLFIHTVPLLTDELRFEKLFHEMFALRQPSTYIHSQMVERISVLIAKRILEVEPALFLPLPGYESVEDLLSRKEELLDAIAKSARFHDIGKFNIASVIMRQSRKINDDEFACIKMHPGLGIDYIENLPGCDMYKDVIHGHHKSYDGKFGYPYDFDNTASPFRFIIDLISISDSTDAATDIIGRNYATGKRFVDLFEELKQGAGTRYNPDIVRIISESPKLIEDLSRLTSDERIECCYYAYRECLKY